jgi:hypothetical protein
MKLLSLLVLLIFSITTSSRALILEGEFKTGSEFFKFVKKFGFVKSEKTKNSYGYLFGNITSDSDFPQDVSVTFAVLDFHHFLEFYSNRQVWFGQRGKVNLLLLLIRLAKVIFCATAAL